MAAPALRDTLARGSASMGVTLNEEALDAAVRTAEKATRNALDTGMSPGEADLFGTAFALGAVIGSKKGADTVRGRVTDGT